MALAELSGADPQNSASAPEAIAPRVTVVEHPESEAVGLCRERPRACGKIGRLP
jgi:hypothetical protein